MKRILFCLIISFLCCQINVMAQLNTGRGYSSSGQSLGNRDRNGTPIDTTAVTDANTLPIGIQQWKIDERFGNVTEIPVDTIEHMFQNTNMNDGMKGHYNHLGNLGSPRLNRVFFDRKEYSEEYFTDPYDIIYVRPQDMIFTNTKSPFSNLSYYKEFDSQNGEERFKSYFAINANKRLGFGFYTDYIYGRGHYTDQSTALFNGGLFSSYRFGKYEMHLFINRNNYKMSENGGITDDRYITNPLDMAEGKRQYKSYDIPVNLQQIWNHNSGKHAFLTHRYSLGFHREHADTIKADSLRLLLHTDTIHKDSIRIIREFVPVTSFIHTVQYDTNKRKYYSYNVSQNEKYWENMYLGNDSIDKTRYISIKNTFGIELREGFNKWAQAGLTAFISHQMRSYHLPDSIFINNLRKHTRYKENNISVGGQLTRREGKTIHYSALGEFNIAGENSGDLTLEGTADLNIRLFGDTIRLDLTGFMKSKKPIFYFRHFHSKHYWWDNEDLSKEMRTHVEGKLSFDKLGTTLRAGAENIKNYTYLANTSIANPSNESTYLNNAAVKQHSSNIQILTAQIEQNFHIGMLHLDAEVTYQKSSEQDILPLPELNVYGNVYLKGTMAKKVLKYELGADVRYFTKYNAPDYAVAIGQYYLQNRDNAMSIGGYPIVNVYFNMHLKRTRLFVMYSHINQGSGSSNYFLAPHYPINPKIFKLGLSWNFFD